ncbi:hypothetical protein JAAARDRAFT_67223 [Jaapia argillacea MUCL 33604]|uniref:tRNA (guanine(26)-N(2))-dimethyltransferase n=1 Tax=Jaapia argillacea MUCL 33604 TaxID=933084 RepID=A0A067Q3R5_9AGAM|nr:hypothetical protein JAAARDRAFT_67223 [Jaapia argillacea MUCL 33604]
MVSDPPITVPEGYTLHTENTASILLPASADAFLNPVQEFNRDLSVACIRVWSEEFNRGKEEKWTRTQGKKAQNGESAEFRPYKFVILEALSATGLRSIRYAKEIPLVKHVIANDLSPAAVEAMKKNIEINGLGSQGATTHTDSIPGEGDVGTSKLGMVRANEGDACALMYNHRTERNRVDVVDLDPYGTAAPFIDAAVQCVNDGGLLCVTCTDLTVLATNNYPEKCYSNYGGIPVKAEYCHESALRLVLHTIATSAARYGRFVEPLLSLSIDFYVRLFVKIRSAPVEVKKLASQTAVYYVCTGCQAFHEQPLSRMIEQVNERSGNVNRHFKTHPGPPVSDRCPECNSVLHIAGPMWSGPIHNTEFIGKVLEHLEGNEDKYGTATRMKGMLTVAKEELPAPFYFTPSRVASFFHCVSPPMDDIASALLHAGHSVSRSHACPGSLKTPASRSVVHDVFRSWVKRNPVKMDNISETSPAHQLLSKEPTFEANFKRHPLSVTPSSKVKLVRYQQNPTSHWGPGSKPTAGKRKRDQEES